MDKTVNLAAIGDIMLGEMPGNNGRGVDTFLKKNGYENVFKYVENCFTNIDIILGNLEAALAKEDKFININKSSLNANPLSIQSLKKINLNVINIANNHILEHGPDNYIKTINILKNSNINVIGSNYGNCVNSFIKNNGLIFNFIGVSLAIDKNYNKDYYYRPDSIEDIINIVNSTKQLADHTIVSIHWGNEHINLPNLMQIELAHNLIDSGVSLILGHHPHCYQGIEEYNDGLIAYSLGNFVFDMDYPMSKETIIFKCNFDSEKIINYDIIPVIINSEGIPTLPSSNLSKQLMEKYYSINNYICNYILTDIGNYDKNFKRKYEVAYKKFKSFIKINFFKKMFSINPKISISLIINFLKKFIR